MNSNLCYLGLLLFPASLFAATADNTLAMLGSEDMYLEDMPIVISATRLEQPLNESPVATTVIDRQMIDASGAQTIPDILRLVPGFTVGYLNGNYPVAAYHGLSDRYSKRIQLVIDGRSVYLPTLAGVSWSDLVITTDDIERIEVVRGPNASTYGNNAFQAVVSITTKHASEDKGQYVKMTVGSYDAADAIYRFGGNNQNDIDYRVSIGTKNNDGTDLLNDFTETDYLSYRLDYQLDTSSSLFYQGGFQDSTYGDIIENASDLDNNADVTTAFQHLKFERSFDDDSSISIQYYYNYTKSFNSNFVTNVSLASASVGTPLEAALANIDDFDVYDTLDLQSERHDLEINYFYNPLDSLRLISGASMRADKVTANDVFNPKTKDTLLLYRFFTHGEYSLTDNWLLNAGFMLEKNDISGTDVSPRLALIHHLNKQHTFRVSASKATRTPTLFDENGYIALQQQLTQNGGQPLNNPLVEGLLGSDTLVDVEYYSSSNVNSEEIISYELGWIMQLIDNKLLIDIKLFSDETSNLITEIPYIADVPGAGVPTENVGGLFGPGYSGIGANDSTNSASSDSQGLEFYADYRITQDWRVYGYFSYIEINAKVTNANITDAVSQEAIYGRYEKSAPRRSYGAMIMKQWENNLNTSLAIYYVGEMDWLDRTSARTDPVNRAYRDRSAEAYTRIDFVLRKSYFFGKNKLDYSFILQNLGGTYYDYTRSNYTDPTFQTVDTPGSKQDARGYFELAFMFN